MHESSGKRGEGKRGEEDRGRKGNALRKEGEEDGYTRITPRCACACVRSGRRSTRSWSTTTKLCGPCRCTRDRPSFPPLFFSRAAQPLTTITYRFTFTLSSLSPIIILRIIRNPPSLRSSLLLFDRYPFKGCLWSSAVCARSMPECLKSESKSGKLFEASNEENICIYFFSDQWID